MTRPCCWSRSTARVSPLGVREAWTASSLIRSSVPLAAGEADEDVEGLVGGAPCLLDLPQEEPAQPGRRLEEQAHRGQPGVGRGPR